ncbi:MULTISPECIES: DUF2971 domain-containing protein [Bacillus cereus group]|uniref:DUF2971 domain-containing protein n=1 Tax=Bacillus cereus TaxID=1396 RepID=A0A1Q4L4C4_BACCE|nr:MULTISPECIES: DUF2971 domain-containing protein [Bacillus cereus group]EJP83496.1 hypothetical protein IAU_05476 [Bacillus cereus IS075]EOO82435.1 hypothetical protein IGS_05792 [Bacillus cereus IS845/00]EOO92562.1 hypothetical protein IGQ_05769 [Bacillus cereus IS195]MDX5927856.1 DUF2971 domain-containing protein [Bacillus cereus group sp. BfR-BA-00967]MDX5975011.1 DUF2971 domain-containing protein [Bacillus cereus group sp. BfR-BA-00287]
MFVENEDINSDINNDAKLWRYMDFTKLVSLLSTSTLYFPRSDQFKDVFEGKIYGYGEEDALITIEQLIDSTNTSENFKRHSRSIVEHVVKSVYDRSEKDKKNVFVNCWHLNEYESAAMWDLYLKNEEGIAIQTTFNSIKKSLDACKEEIFIGKVKYVDPAKYKNLNNSFIEPFFTKRMSFSHEKEVRLIYAPVIDVYDDEQCPDESIIGKNIRMNLDELIEKVYVSPDAAPWFVEVVRVVLEKFDVNAEIVHSDLYKIR